MIGIASRLDSNTESITSNNTYSNIVKILIYKKIKLNKTGLQPVSRTCGTTTSAQRAGIGH